MIACGPQPRAAVDADDDGESPSARCGDGHIDRSYGTTDAPWVYEDCDDGLANGTPASQCTRQCFYWTTEWVVGETHSLSLAPRASVVLSTHGLAYTAFDDRGVRILPDYRNPQSEIELHPGGHPIALGAALVKSIGSAPIWVERDPTDARLHLFVAGWTGGVADIHEIPYPFPDGSNPSFVTAQGSFVAVLVDQRSAGSNLLVATIAVRAFDDVRVQTWELPARGSKTHTAVTPNYTAKYRQQLVQFFDANEYAAFWIEQPAGDPWAEHSDYQLDMISRGSWPYTIVESDEWNEALLYSITPATDPPPLLLETDTGDVLIWQFSRGPTVEEIVPLYAHVIPGGPMCEGGQALWAVDGAGQVLWVPDGDPYDLASSGIMPLHRWLVAPFSVHTRARGFGLEKWLTLDATLLLTL